MQVASAKPVPSFGTVRGCFRIWLCPRNAVVADAIGECPGWSVVGGGDSVRAVVEGGFAEEIDHISTGGGASLEFIEGQNLPGLAPLMVEA